MIIGTIEQYPTESMAWRGVESFRIATSVENVNQSVLFGALVDRYMREKLPKRYSTASKYRSWLRNHVKPKWGDVPIRKVKPLLVEEWLMSLDLAPKSKGHLRSIMHILFNWAMKWELIELDRMNPISLVRVEGSSKRLKRPKVLTPDEFRLLLNHLEEPIRTMCIVAACLGLRASELAGLQWGDFDWRNRQVHIQRGFVIGHIDDVKTENSNRSLPVHPELATLLLDYKEETAPQAKNTDWLFPSPYGTGRPRWPWTIQSRILLPAGIRAGLGRIGWHTFRHSYSTLLRGLGVDVKVQQELLRHADIRTTMNIYTQAVPDALRDANSKVVEMVLPNRKVG
ncbi:MAG TPA: tyrosine-type recombinase/integrase [Candidatus Acidoferrales bacterium]|nr:tyrosine-type recombinase/integrase [Candidatus Acidoferrales bacterium]